jgi:hypothetical protein
MKFRVDPVVARLMIVLVAIPATALCIIQLARLKHWVDDRRANDYVRRVQPQLTSDPQFKYVELHAYHADGCVSNSDALASLKSYIEESKPPFPLSFSLVSTNSADWTWHEDHERLMQRAKEGSDLVGKADVILEEFGDGAMFLTPRNTNVVKTPSEFQAALNSVEHRGLALIKIQAVRVSGVTNNIAASVAILKQCGFRDVRVVMERWGMTFPYSGSW